MLSGLGCSSEDVESPRVGIPTFPAEYWFVNTGDRSINAVEIRGNTYYPYRDRSWYEMHNWQNPTPDAELMLRAEDDVYLGCRVQIIIAVNKLWDPGDPHARWRFWATEIDTVRDPSDAIVTFSWPADTDSTTELDDVPF
jgi:hypothetical protein